MIKVVRAAMLLVLALTLFIMPGTPAAAQAGIRTFPETGKTVAGKFLTYWENHGGLAQQGYPISSQMQDVSPVDGQVYTVQYFERAVFELHPDNSPPNDVELSLLGAFHYKEKYPGGAPDQAANNAPGAVTFKETGMTLGGGFLSYWQQHGGLAQQGYPISNEFQEKSDLDGKTYTVQYFERAVFEYHPDNSPPNDVLLSQLGKFRYDAVEQPGARIQSTFEELWWLVKQDYVYTDYRGLDWQALHDEYLAKIVATSSDADAYTLINELIQKLNDHHTQFQDPQLRAEDDALRTGTLKFSGIGVITQVIDNARRISYVVPDGPADKAGLRAFDVILAVDGVTFDQDPNAISKVRGEEGTPVTLTIQSPGEDPRDVTIIRAQVSFAYHATARRLPGSNIAFLDFPTFNDFGIANEARQALQTLANSGPLDGLVIDVRLNGGGLIDEELQLAGVFINGGIGGYSAGRASREADRIPAGRVLQALQGKPIVVLTSDACESACEHFSVAMHDLKRATILGTATAGNTETLYPHDLLDGSRLLLAERTFQRPDGSSIEDKGLQPDVLLDVPWYKYKPGEDPQTQAAIGLIEGK